MFSDERLFQLFTGKINRFINYRTGILLLLLVFVLIAGPGQASSSSGGIPTFSIQSVTADQTVTILTQNFPAGQDFAVTMGIMGSRGIDGYLVDTTNSGTGGTFTATYTIPEQLKGSYQIAIRLQSKQGYYAYNWFYNNTAAVNVDTGASTGETAGDSTGYSGIPTFDITAVTTDKTVTIKTNNFPAHQTFTVTMGPNGTRGIDGVVVGTFDSGSGGIFTKTFDIPDKFKGAEIIAIRAQTAHVNPYFAYNWFYNNTTSPAAPAEADTDAAEAASTPAPVIAYTGIPTIHMCSVVRDKTVMFRANNFPPNQTFTVRMGAMWTAGVGGYIVGSFNSEDGGAFEKTFDIPAELAGVYRISIRAETAHAYPFYAYNWFYNSTASVCD